jgi:hypothetical protein
MSSYKEILHIQIPVRSFVLIIKSQKKKKKKNFGVL